MREELEYLVAQVYRSTDVELLELAQTLPAMKRAALTVFCFSRSHLREQAITLAEACDPNDLRTAGGVPMSVQLAQQLDHKRASSTLGKRLAFPQITLASQDLGAKRTAGAEDAELEVFDNEDDLSSTPGDLLHPV